MKKWISLILAAVIAMAPLNSFAAGFPVIPPIDTPEDKESFLEQYILQNYKMDVTSDQLDLAKYKGMFQSLDPYSSFYTEAEYKTLMENLSGNFVGIGIYIEVSGKYIKITKPIKGSPAEKAGLESGDVIYKVDGKDIRGMTDETVVKMIKGDEGTLVKITVWKASTGKEVTVTIARAPIHIEVVTAKLHGSVLHVALSDFTEDSAKQVVEAIAKYPAAKGIVLDLRDNPGGYLSQAISLADFFLNAGSEIVRVDYKNDEDEVIKDETMGYKLPMVVLVNKNSASASEIVASALQKNNRAKVVGVNSYGKGTVQDILKLPTGEAVKLTVAEYMGPNFTKINGVGVKPDFEVIANDQSIAKTILAFAPMTEGKAYKAGETGLNVYGAQQRLNLLNNLQLPLTAVMDAKTVSAIKAFQSAGKLKITGLLDSGTKKLLDEKTTQLYNRITSDNQLEKALELLKAQ